MSFQEYVYYLRLIVKNDAPENLTLESWGWCLLPHIGLRDLG